MSKKPRDARPYIPPVKKITLDEGNLKGRFILLAVLLIVAVVAIGMGLYYGLSTEPGWQNVECASGELNCSGDFVFLYECGNTGLNATSEYKGVTAVYSQLCREAYDIFSAETLTERHNVAWLNQHPNETVSVDPVLYEALSLVVEYGSRDLFLAPAVRQYNSVFLAANDAEAALYDPMKDPQRMEYVEEILAFVRNPAMISLEILEENQVRLNVDAAYLAYGEENEIGIYLDFGWMKNAFIADYLAVKLTEGGYTNGYLVSYDGFTRNLDSRGTQYHVNIFDRHEDSVYMPAQMTYTGPMSMVSLRNYPLAEEDQWHYYAYADGSVTSVYMSLESGMPVFSTDNLFCYSDAQSCAEILLQAAPLYLTEKFDRQGVLALCGKEIHSIWAEGRILYHSEKNADLALIQDTVSDSYSLQYAE